MRHKYSPPTTPTVWLAQPTARHFAMHLSVSAVVSTTTFWRHVGYSTRPGAQRSQSTPEYFDVSHTEQFRPDHWFLQVQAHCVPSALTATETARALQSWRGLHARHDGFKVPAGHASQSALL